MNKYEVEKHMGLASETICKVYKQDKIDKDKIDKMMRSKMAAFGAMVLMSGVTPAIAYYSDNEPKIVELISEMYLQNSLINTPKDNVCTNKPVDFFNRIVMDMQTNGKPDCKKKQIVTEKIINYSISLKMAFNLFELTT